MYAVINAGGKQFCVRQGDIIEVEKLNASIGDRIELNATFKSDGSNAQTGSFVVPAEVVAQVKGKKITIFKYKAKKNVRKKQGHRQRYTKIKILSI